MFPFRKLIRDGSAGANDIEEAFDNATHVIVSAQIDAGMDILSDGELRRQRFVYEMYDRLRGIEQVPSSRRLGVPGYDMAPSFITTETVTAPDGLGLVSEYHALRPIAPEDRLKIALPGPLTFANNIAPGPTYSSGGMEALLADLGTIIHSEMAALSAAGADFVQLDEPGFANPPGDLPLEIGSSAINRTLEALESTTAVHVCFGNNASRPFVRRDFGRLMLIMVMLECDILLLEFANLEMPNMA